VITAVRTQATAAPSHKKIYQHLYVQVLCAIAVGVLLGHFYPSLGAQMKPLGDMFIQAIKMVIAPIIFCTVVHGIASMKDMKKVGRVGLKAIVYFEVVTTLALVVGLIVANLWQPGAGMNVDAGTIDAKSIQQYTAQAHEQSALDYVTHIIPATVIGAFAAGEILIRALKWSHRRPSSSRPSPPSSRASPARTRSGLSPARSLSEL
jgi:aerobic C4-dicarboxylate transport protein